MMWLKLIELCKKLLQDTFLRPGRPCVIVSHQNTICQFQLHAFQAGTCLLDVLVTEVTTIQIRHFPVDVFTLTALGSI